MNVRNRFCWREFEYKHKCACI